MDLDIQPVSSPTGTLDLQPATTSSSSTGSDQSTLQNVASRINSVIGPSMQQVGSQQSMQPYSSITDPITSLFPKANGDPLSQAWESVKGLLQLPSRLSTTLGSASGPVSDAVANDLPSFVSKHFEGTQMPAELTAALAMAAGAIVDPRNIAAAGIENPEPVGIDPNPVAQNAGADFAQAGVTPTPAQLTQGKLAQMVETLGKRYPYSAQKFQDFYSSQMADLDNVRATLMSTVGDNAATQQVTTMMKQRISSYLQNATPEEAATLQDKFGDLDSYMKNEQAGQFGQGMLAAASKMARDKADAMYANLPIHPQTPIPTPQFSDLAKQFLSDELQAPKPDRNTSWVNRLSQYASLAPEIQSKVANLDLSEATNPAAAQDLVNQIKESIQPQPQVPFAGTQMAMKSLRDLRIQNDPGYLLGASGQGNRFAGYAAQLRGALASDIQDGVNAVSPQAGQMLQDANANYAQYKQMFNDPYITGLLKSDPEDFMSHAIKPNDIANIGMLKQAVGPDNFLPIKQNFLANMLVNKEGDISPSGFVNKVNKFGMPTLSTVFDTDELTEITRAQDIFNRMGAAEKSTGNPSGTAGMMMANRVILGAPSDALLTLLGGKVGFAVAIAKNVVKNYVFPRVLANAYLSDSVRDLMVNGLVAPDSAMAALGVMGKASMAGVNQTISGTPDQQAPQGQMQ